MNFKCIVRENVKVIGLGLCWMSGDFLSLFPVRNVIWTWVRFSTVVDIISIRNAAYASRKSHLWVYGNPHGRVTSNFQHIFSAKCCFMSLGTKWLDHTCLTTSDRWYLRWSFENELSVLLLPPNSPVSLERHAVSEWAISWLMGRPWLSAELATAVTGSHSARYPCDVIWKTWSTNALLIQYLNYFSEFSMLQDALVVPLFFTSLHFP
jgi:hypothetical protein